MINPIPVRLVMTPVGEIAKAGETDIKAENLTKEELEKCIQESKESQKQKS